MLVRILDAFGCALDEDATLAERERARLVVASCLVGAIFFAIEAFVQASRANLPFAAIAAATALGFTLLPAFVRLRPTNWMGHAVAALLALHILSKLAVTGGETRAFGLMGMFPLIVLPLCGLRATLAWVLGLCGGLGAIYLGEVMGRPFPVRLDADLVAQDSLLVAIAGGLSGLMIAGWYQSVYRASRAEVARSQEQTDHAQYELRASHERNRALLTHAFDGVVILDDGFHISYLSPGSEGTQLGYNRSDIDGGGLLGLVEQIIHPDDRSSTIEAFRSCRETPGKLVRSTVRLRRRTGGYSTFDASIHNLTDEPAVAGLVVNYRDISNDTFEPGSPASRLATPDEPSERFASFAAGAAHAYNNLLTAILGRTSMLQMTLPDEPAVQEDLREIERAATRAADVTDDILLYAGASQPNLEELDLPSLLSDISRTTGSEGSFPDGVEVHPSDDPTTFQADRPMIRAAIARLVENGLEASGRTEPIEVRGALVVADTAMLEGGLDFSGGTLDGRACVALSVEDRAGGIAPDHQGRIFDPFFSTRFLGRGLGLAAVLGAVRVHRGAIRVESSPASGTTVTLLLPA